MSQTDTDPRDPARSPLPGEAVSTDAVADPDGNLTQLHPNYKTLLRLITIFVMVPVMILALVAEAALSQVDGWPTGLISGVVLLVALVLVIRVPSRRYGARGYNMSADRIRVVRGVWWHSDTVVPFGRVQHIDVDQGPVERAFNIATLTLHTAGNHNASVHLPGLEQELAKDLREEIRAHIKRESL